MQFHVTVGQQSNGPWDSFFDYVHTGKVPYVAMECARNISIWDFRRGSSTIALPAGGRCSSYFIAAVIRRRD
jgi:hypothetical protein